MLAWRSDAARAAAPVVVASAVNYVDRPFTRQLERRFCTAARLGDDVVRLGTV